MNAVVKKNTEAVPAKVESKSKAPVVAVKAVPAPAPAEEEAQAKIGRKQVAAAIAEKVKATGKAVPLSIAEIMVVAYEEVVAESLAGGVEVALPGFGKFMVKDKEAGEKRNPSNGEMVMVAAHKAVRFKVGAGLKKAVNAGAEVGGDE